MVPIFYFQSRLNDGDPGAKSNTGTCDHSKKNVMLNQLVIRYTAAETTVNTVYKKLRKTTRR